MNELREGPSGCTPGDGVRPSITNRLFTRFSSHLPVPHRLSLLLLADSRERDHGRVQARALDVNCEAVLVHGLSQSLTELEMMLHNIHGI